MRVFIAFIISLAISIFAVVYAMPSYGATVVRNEISFTDPNADRILFWDDSVDDIGILSLGTHLSISGTVLNVDFSDYFNTSTDDSDDITEGASNLFLTSTERIKLSNTSGTNTGDQTSIIGITGTKAEFDTALTDGDFLYVGDITQYTDEQAQDAIGAMVNSTLSYIDATPALGINLTNPNTWTGQQTFNTLAPIFGTMTQGSVLFAGSGGLLSEDNTNLFLDDNNNTLGIGTTRTGAISSSNPRLRIKGSGTTTNMALEVTNSSNVSTFSATDAGTVSVGDSIFVPYTATGTLRYVNYAFANFGRRFGMYVEASGNEGGFTADSQFTLRATNGINMVTGDGSGGFNAISMSSDYGGTVPGFSSAAKVLIEETSSRLIIFGGGSARKLASRGGWARPAAGSPVVNILGLASDTAPALTVRQLSSVDPFSDSLGGTVMMSVAPSGLITNRLVTKQQQWEYDGSNYANIIVGSTGVTTFDATGSGAAFTFSDDVGVPDEVYGSGWDGSLEVPTKNAVYDKIETLSGAPTGSLMQFAGSSAPTGYLLCDGSAVSRSAYSALFALISTTYGAGDGSTTFNVPDLKGRVAVGYDSGQTEFDTLGETGGANTHTLTTGEIPSHDHSTGSGMEVLNTPGTSTYATLTDGAGASGTTGGGGAHNNLQPYITLNYIVKY